jgi:hypothetical protein
MLSRIAIIILAAAGAYAQVLTPPNIGEAEAQRVEEKIATVRRDVLGKYELSLGELQNQFQKAADLDGALAVRSERTRLNTEQALSEKNLVNEPKSLRNLQESTLRRMQDLVSGVVNEAVPKLVDYKKQLTVEGKLDEAVAVRQAIERLQNANVPVTRAEAGGIVGAETILQAYSADRSRADKTYKGVRFVVRGLNGGYRIDPNDAKSLHVFVGGQNTTGWVQCSFNLAQWRYREEKIGAVTYLVLIGRDGGETRLGKGLQVDILGDCHGWDELVKMTKCDVSR